MLLKDYEQKGLFFNTQLAEPCSDAKFEAWRGDLILIGREDGNVKLPQPKVMPQAVLLGSEGKIAFLSGLLERIADLPLLLSRIGGEVTATTLAILFVIDIDKPVIASFNGAELKLEALAEGLPWTELMQLAGLEKADVKNLSTPDKIKRVYEELLDYKPRNVASVSVEAATALSNGKLREVRGAV